MCSSDTILINTRTGVLVRTDTIFRFKRIILRAAKKKNNAIVSPLPSLGRSPRHEV